MREPARRSPSTSPNASVARSVGPGADVTSGRPGLIEMQQQAGNQAVGRLVRGDGLERQADADADRIVARPASEALGRAAESVLGTSLAGVRMHRGEEARAVTEAHDARALTVGQDVYVAPDQWAPGTATGRHLLAHELAHVAQQSAHGVVAAQAKPREEKQPPDLAGAALGIVDDLTRSVSQAVTLGHGTVGVADVANFIATPSEASLKAAAQTKAEHAEDAAYDKVGQLLNKLRAISRPPQGTLSLDTLSLPPDLADSVLGILAGLPAPTAGNQARKIIFIQNHAEDLQGVLGPFGFSSEFRGSDSGGQWAEEYDTAITRWLGADAQTRQAYRARGTGIQWSQKGQQVRDAQRVANQLPDGTYTYNTTAADYRVQYSYAVGEHVKQQIDGVVNSGPSSLLGRVLGGERGAELFAIGDTLLPLGAAIKGVGAGGGGGGPRPSEPSYEPPSVRVKPEPAVPAPRAEPEPVAEPANVRPLPAPVRPTAGQPTEAQVAKAVQTGAATPIGSARQSTPSGPVPVPPVRLSNRQVAQAPVADVDVAGNTALKRETGGNDTSTGAGGTRAAAGDVKTQRLETIRARQAARESASRGTAPRTVPAPPGRTGPGGQTIRQEYPPQAYHDIADLEDAHPQLRDANLRPVNRGAGRGKFEERMTTTGTSYSFQGELPNGGVVELDGITADGRVLDNKELTSVATRYEQFRNAGRGDSPPDVHEQVTGTGAARPGPTRETFDRQIAREVEGYGDQLARQSQFIDAYHLRGGEWRVPEDWKPLLDAELTRRGITNIRMVVHD